MLFDTLAEVYWRAGGGEVAEKAIDLTQASINDIELELDEVEDLVERFKPTQADPFKRAAEKLKGWLKNKRAYHSCQLIRMKKEGSVKLDQCLWCLFSIDVKGYDCGSAAKGNG